MSALSSFAQGWPPPTAFGWGHWRPEISNSFQKSIQLFIENVVQLLTPFFLLSRNENGLQKRNSVNCLQPQFQKEGAKLFPFVSSPLAFFVLPHTHMFDFRAELRRPSPQVEKRANLHFHENNLRGNLFQAIHRVFTSSCIILRKQRLLQNANPE